MTSEYFGPAKDVAFGIGQTFDYDQFKLWIERQQWNFSKSITISGDLISANWDGASPLDLSAVDGDATVGWAFDTSAGSGQLMGSLFVGGDVVLVGSGAFRTAASGNRWELSAADQDHIAIYSGDGDEVNEGYFSGGVSGAGGSRTLQVALRPPSLTSNLHTYLTLSSESEDGTAPPKIIVGVENVGSHVPEFKFQNGMRLLLEDGTSSRPALAFNNQLGTGLRLGSSDELVIQTPDGYIEIGPKNTSFAHIYTDRDTFAINKEIAMVGNGTLGTSAYPASHLYLSSGAEVYVGGTARISWDEGGGAGDTLFYDDAGNIHFFHDASVDAHRWFPEDGSLGTEAMRLRDGATVNGSSLYLNDDLTDVGNHETLRLNRGTGTSLQLVGYYSSWIKDPITGKPRKRRVVPLTRKSKWWNPDWFMDLEPIKYERIQNQDRDTSFQSRQIEIGFSIENLIQHTNLLTTKGSEVGGSPDEYALLAVTVDYVQRLERRVAALEQGVN